jgi:hypothetical protein
MPFFQDSANVGPPVSIMSKGQKKRAAQQAMKEQRLQQESLQASQQEEQHEPRSEPPTNAGPLDEDAIERKDQKKKRPE